MLNDIKRELKSLSDPVRAKHSGRYFKTGKGEYGEGDKFLGLTVPEQRKIAKKYFDQLTFDEVKNLLSSNIHEYRFAATEVLNFKYKKATSDLEKKKVVTFYIRNLHGINNWDLVDNTAYSILGVWLLDKEKKILYKFAQSKNLWKKRIAIISTLWFIREGEFKDALSIAEILLYDKHDLIHKAVGWVLREIGKKDREVEEEFLKRHYKTMPRTMLRYAIEKFPEGRRKAYLHGTV